jgi:putative PIN family toxin of toxin-antitoxin system
MIVWIDANTLTQGRNPGHRCFPILDAIVFGRITWAVSNRILMEYQEVLSRTSGLAAWADMARLMELVELTTGSILWISPHFQFNVISADPDDNAFTDCAIAAGADYVIIEDIHFSPLTNAGYRPQPLTPAVFIERHGSLLMGA